MRFLNIFLLSSFISITAFAADPAIEVAKNSSQISSSLRGLADGQMVSGTYQDDEGKNRTDKVYYGADFSFITNLKRSDIDSMINPANGRLPQLFSDRVTIRSKGGSSFAMDTTVKVFVTTLQFNGTMNYSSRSSGNSTVHSFSTHSYNSFLFQNRIRAEVTDLANGQTKVHVLQIAAVKGSAQEKLDKIPFGNSKFKSRVLANAKKFKTTLGATN